MNESTPQARHIAEVKASRERIAPIPADLKVNPQILAGLPGVEFLNAFGELQEFVIQCYKNIESDPIAWGYPDPYKQKSGNGGISIGPHEKRLTAFLYALSAAGVLENGILTVDFKAFNNHFKLWAHTKPEAMLNGFAEHGLIIENFSKKSSHFSVKYPKNPHVLQALCAHFASRPCRRCYGACNHMGSCYWGGAITPVTIFSYRFIEDPTEQKQEIEFLAFVSGMPEELQQIQFYLYSESKRYGYRFDPFKPVWSGGLLYEKRAVEWPRVGYIGDGWHGDDYRMFSFRCHIKPNKIFKTHPQKIIEFAKQRPDVFTNPDHMCNQHCGKTLNNICHAHRVSYEIDGVTYHNCGGIRIHNPSFEDVKTIVELFVLENNLTPVF
jgi:hypothetical protein